MLRGVYFSSYSRFPYLYDFLRILFEAARCLVGHTMDMRRFPQQKMGFKNNELWNF